MRLRITPLIPLFLAFNSLYVVGLAGWATLFFLFGDRWWWMYFLNSFAQYFFVPLPVLVLIALVVRKRIVWAGVAFVLVLGLAFYGDFLVPPLPRGQIDGSTLTVMTYNRLGFNRSTAGVADMVRAAGADVILFQELNPEVAAVLQRDLIAAYPYQELDPRDGVVGLGTISRFPLQPIDAHLEGSWVGSPQLLRLDFAGTPVTVLNFHTIPPAITSPFTPGAQDWMNGIIRERERQSRVIGDLAKAHPGPFLAAGDLNAGDLSDAYAIITRSLKDAWREGGWGFGHTFPGAAMHGSSRPFIAGFYVPTWLVRIDYVFHSDHWQTVSARIGPWDGQSDHRPVLATLSLR
jgi:endonuclease/exonuclease/phosphatase (EEP) superfamily protein YafD